MEKSLLIRFYGVRGGYPDSQQMVSFSISTNSDSFLFDCGSPNVFLYPDVIKHLSHIFVTHHHHDHIALLPNIILGKMLSADKTKLHVVSPESIQLLVESMEIAATDYFHSTCMPDMVSNFVVTHTVTKHLRTNYCYKLTGTGITITYTGDTAYDPKLSQFCAQSDILILEGSYSDVAIATAERFGHLTPTTAAKLINESQPKMAILTHFIQLTSDDFIREMTKHVKISTHIIAAHDGLELRT